MKVRKKTVEVEAIGIIRKAIMIAMQFSVHLELHIRHWEESNETD